MIHRYTILVELNTPESRDRVFCPPTPEDGEQDPHDCLYPSLADCVTDLQDAVLAPHADLLLAVSVVDTEGMNAALRGHGIDPEAE